MALSDYLEDKLLDFVFNNVNYVRPTTIYIALFTAAPSDAGGGTEVSGSNYARVGVSGGFPTTGTATRASNSSAITFPSATGSWGTITHVGIFDASSGGNLLAWGALSASKTIGATDQFTFAVDALGITLS